MSLGHTKNGAGFTDVHSKCSKQGFLGLLLLFLLLVCDVRGFNETQIEDLPDQIYLTAADSDFLGPVLNAFAHLARLGVNVSKTCYVLCLDEPSAELFHSLGMNALWVPSIMEKARKTSQANHQCRQFFGKPKMNLLMTILYPLYAKIFRSGRRLMTFDSDVIFYQNPQDFFDLSDIADYIAYSYKRKGIGSRPFILGSEGQVTLNAAPAFWLNPTALTPWVDRMNNISLKLESWCKHGWHQQATQAAFFECGLRFERLGVVASTNCSGELPNLRVFPCPFQKYYAHYAGTGDATSKFDKMRKAGDWIIGDNYKKNLQTLLGEYPFKVIPFSAVLARVGVEPGMAVSGTVTVPCDGHWETSPKHNHKK